MKEGPLPNVKLRNRPLYFWTVMTNQSETYLKRRKSTTTVENERKKSYRYIFKIFDFKSCKEILKKYLLSVKRLVNFWTIIDKDNTVSTSFQKNILGKF